MDDSFVLLLHEVAYHPNSYLAKLTSMFEVTSVIKITRKEMARKYRSKPIFDEKYLLIFDDVKVFEQNCPEISFVTTFPVVHVEAQTQLDDAVFFCKTSGVPYKIYKNAFTKEQAFEFIATNSKQRVSNSFCKAVVKQTGLSPLRIMTALAVCEQMGYTEAVIDKYVDKWVYPDVRKLIECLLDVPRSASAVRASVQYLSLNRFWYRHVKRIILDELSYVVDIFEAKMSGLLGESNLLVFLDTHNITRARVMYALRLFDRVSITAVIGLREYIKSATLMDVIIKLTLGGS